MSDSIERQIAAASRLAEAGAWREARDTLQSVIGAQPDAVAARRALVHCHLRLGDATSALETARHATLLDDARMLGEVLAELDAARATEPYVELLRARAERHPRDYRAALALAAALHRLGRPSEALPWAMRAHQIEPRERQPIEIRAVAMIDRGDVEAGLALCRDLVARYDDREAAARHLVLMHYDPAQTNARLFDALQAFAERHLRRWGPPFTATRDPNPKRALRVGWLSPRFNEGPVAVFLTGLLRAFDRTRYRHLLIALQPGADAATARLKALGHEWFDLSGLDDATLLQRLRALELDVLVDLAGHATANRLAVVAQRAAPVQVSWLDWFNTTAAPSMDAWISDRWLTPEETTQRYTERLIRLDAGRFCYTPPEDAPPATRVGSGEVVFASFHRLAKLNADVLATWAAILRRVPGARLELGARLLDDPATRAYTLERFAAHGVGAERLGLHGQRPYRELLAAYRAVDIALDPFPFSGCTTTCDALFMGTAVVTWPSETFVSRQSASLLQRLGRAEWIARDREDYIERAVALASDVSALRRHRESLRADVSVRLCDASAQARDFAALLDRLCARAPP
ncbi:MAG TPA: tetratricopeptide repeat protein [Rhodanobacteraceae bacterium]